MTRLLRAREVAGLLGVTLTWWYRNRRGLEAQGFPRPVRLGARLDRWDAVAIEAWVARHRGDDVAGWRARLAARLDAPAVPVGRGRHGTQANPLPD